MRRDPDPNYWWIFVCRACEDSEDESEIDNFEESEEEEPVDLGESSN